MLAIKLIKLYKQNQTNSLMDWENNSLVASVLSFKGLFSDGLTQERSEAMRKKFSLNVQAADNRIKSF